MVEQQYLGLIRVSESLLVRVHAGEELGSGPGGKGVERSTELVGNCPRNEGRIVIQHLKPGEGAKKATNVICFAIEVNEGAGTYSYSNTLSAVGPANLMCFIWNEIAFGIGSLI